MSKKQEKLPGAHGRIKHSHGRKKDGMYYADFVPQNVPTLMAKTKVNIRHFLKEYAFACKVTAALLLVVVAAIIIRYSQQASLAALLADVTTVTQDYNSLVNGSSNKSAETNEASDELLSATATTPSGSAGSTAFSFSQNQPNTNDSNADDQPPTNPDDGGGTGNEDPPPPSPPFASAIAGFELLNPNGSIECPGTITITRINCTKTYQFRARVNTQNGPGQVNYGWLTDVPGGNSNGSYNAGPGNQSQDVAKSVTISCRNEGNYAMRFVITAPNSVQSSPATINHDCGS